MFVPCLAMMWPAPLPTWFCPIRSQISQSKFSQLCLSSPLLTFHPSGVQESHAGWEPWRHRVLPWACQWSTTQLALQQTITNNNNVNINNNTDNNRFSKGFYWYKIPQVPP